MRRSTRHELVHALQEFLLSLVPLACPCRRSSSTRRSTSSQTSWSSCGSSRMFTTPRGRCCRSCSSASRSLEARAVAAGAAAIEAARVAARPARAARDRRALAVHRSPACGGPERRGHAARRGHVRPEALSAIWRLSGGTPRVINLLCDRALEAAYEKQAHSVGGPLVDAAAAELGLLTVPPAVAARSGAMPTVAAPTIAAPIVAAPTVVAPTVVAPVAAPSVREAGDPWAPGPLEEMPVAFGGAAGAETPAPPRSRLLLVAAVVVVAAGAAWFGVRALYPSGQSASTPPAEQAAPAAPPADRPAPGAPPPAAAPPSNAPAPSPATSAAAPVPSPATSPAPSSTEPGAPPASGPPAAFEIVVASFRTMTRASQVAAELEALGQPVRQRTSDGWQQVLAGPFQDPGGGQTSAGEASTRRDTPARRSSPPAPPVPGRALTS